MEDMDVDMLPRVQATYVSHNEKFELKKQKYKGQQYSQLYFFRLTFTRQYLNPRIKERWPSYIVTNILGLDEGKVCVVIGTLYKQMKLKPNILDEYSKERSVGGLVVPSNFTDAEDYLILEDESGRVKLVGNCISPSVYVTGVVVAVCGQPGKDGEFLVEEILEPGLAPQPPLPTRKKSESEKYVAFVSGLRCGGPETNPLQVQLLVDHLTGHLGEEQEQSLSAQVVRTIIAGDSVQLQAQALHGQPLSSKDQHKLIEPIKELDLVLTQLASAMPVDIMPGSKDPANFSLPQQPLHKCLFPGATAYSTFVSATNPHQFELDGVGFLGTSGQNIEDLDKYSLADDPVDYMERTLSWRHIAPTAPDTLGCYPFHDRDPFLIEPSCPHVYFCGNQDKFSTRLIRGPKGEMVRLVCIPRFAETGTAVLVSLSTLECHCVTLSTSLLEISSIEDIKPDIKP
ncbi:DNA polymerase delta subunit 2 [Marchantia polymorpha subsp. ruderalis]